MGSSASAEAPIDLSSYAIMSSFARSAQSARIPAFLDRMDAQDGWAVDFREDESAEVLKVKALVRDLQRMLNGGGMLRLRAAPREFLELLGGLRTSRCLYLLKMAGERDPGLGAVLEELLSVAPPSDRLLAVVRQRIEVFTKAQLLGDVFSSSRLERIKSIMEAERKW